MLEYWCWVLCGASVGKVYGDLVVLSRADAHTCSKNDVVISGHQQVYLTFLVGNEKRWISLSTATTVFGKDMDLHWSTSSFPVKLTDYRAWMWITCVFQDLRLVTEKMFMSIETVVQAVKKHLGTLWEGSSRFLNDLHLLWGQNPLLRDAVTFPESPSQNGRWIPFTKQGSVFFKNK